MSKFEEFLQEISPLPLEIRRSLILMRQLDSKKDELSNTNNRLVKQYFQSLSKQKNKDQKYCHPLLAQIRGNYDKI